MTWVATGIALLAAAATTYNTVETNKKQDRQAAAGIRKQAANQREANAKINDTVTKLGRDDAANTAKATVGKQYLNSVRTSMANANAGLARKGLNADFDARAGGAAAANDTFGTQTADMLARMDAPLLQRRMEGNVAGNTGMDLSVIGSKVQGDAFLNQMAMNGIRRNPYIDFAAAVGNAYAGASAGGGMTARAPSNGGIVPAGYSTAPNGSSNLYPGAWGA